MQDQYVRAGAGLSGVLQARFDTARNTGRLDEAGRWLAELKRTPRDEYSNCEACVRSQEARYLYAVDHDDEGLALADEILNENLTCGDEPEATMAQALLPLLRAGRTDEAGRLHRRGYRMARDEPAKLGMIAQHLTFCAITGNEARGLELLERHIGWLVHDGLDDAAHFEALSAMGVLLDAVTAAGSGTEVVRAAADSRLIPLLGKRPADRPWTAQDLSGAVWSAAVELAARFDRRNENDHYQGLLTAAHVLAGVRFDVPLTSDPALLGLTPTAETEPVDAEGFLVRAEELAVLQVPARALAAVRAGLGTDPEPALRAKLLDVEIGVHQDAGDAEAARSLLDERARALREAGDEEQARVQERLGLALWGAATTQPGDQAGDETIAAIRAELAQVEGPVLRARLAGVVGLLERAKPGAGDDDLDRWILELARGAGDTANVQAALASMADRQAGQGELEQALPLLEEALAEGDDRGRRISLERFHLHLLGAMGRFEDALVAARVALGLAVTLECRWWSTELANLTANLANQAGRPDQAVAHWRLAIREASLGELPDLAALRFQLGRYLGQLGRADEAAEELQEVLRLETAAGAAPADRAATLYWLGAAHRQTDEPGAAYQAWTASVGLYLEAEVFGGAARSGVVLGQLLAGYQDAEALDVLDRAVAAARKVTDESRWLVDALHVQGRTRCQFGDDGGLDQIEEAIALDEQTAAGTAHWAHADLLDSLAREYLRLGRIDAGLALVLRSAAEFRELDHQANAGDALVVGARALLQDGRPAGALPLLIEAIGLLESAPDVLAQACLLAGDAHETLGQHAEAAQVRALIS
jgi:tetratricopeptide (TPR) repeat protein